MHIVDLRIFSKFLSISIIHDRPNRRLWLLSHIYISKLLDEWNLSSCKVASTPFPSKFTEFSSVTLTSAPTSDIPDPDLTVKYQRIVGCLLYLAVSTRPDISYYAMWLGQYNSKPTHAQFLIAKHVLRYLAGTKTLALCLGSSSASLPATLSSFMQNVGCSDVDWASDAVDRKSISGYSFYFEASLISWSATKQKSITLSSTEAEYYALTHAFKEALWLRVFLGLLHFPVPQPFPILSDNQAACSLSNSTAVSARSKHIDICHHFIHAHVQDGSFTTTWIPTADMPADIFMKPLPFVAIVMFWVFLLLLLDSFFFLFHSDLMGVCWTYSLSGRLSHHVILVFPISRSLIHLILSCLSILDTEEYVHLFCFCLRIADLYT